MTAPKTSRKVRNRQTAAVPAATVPGVKDVPALQPPVEKGQALIRGGTTSGTPGQLVRYWNRWRENYNALTGLTIARVRQLIEQSQRGDTAYVQWTYRTIERRHPVLKALIDLCEAPLENFQWDVRVKKKLPDGFTEADALKQKEKLVAAYGQIDNIQEAILHLFMADFRGFAHVQKHYLDGEVVHLECLFQYCVCRDGLFGDWFWNPDSRQLTMPEYVLTDKNRIGGDVLPRADFIIRECDRPINEIALENFVRRKLIEKDWSAFDEIFGIPSGVITMPSGIPPELVSEYEASAKAIAEGGTGAMPAGSTYTPNRAPADGSDLFKNHLTQLDEDMVLAGTGGKLKMLVQQGSGQQRGNSKVQDDNFGMIARSRGNKVAESFREDFDKHFLAENFPAQPPLVEFCLVTEDAIDIGELVTNVASLATAGYDVDASWLSDQTGYPLAKAAPPAPSLPGQPPKPGQPPEENNFPPGSPEDLAAKKKLALKNRSLQTATMAQADDLAATLHEMILPLLKRLEAIAAVDDAGIQQHMVEKLLKDIPAIANAIQADDSLAKKLSPQLAGALVAGLTTKPPSHQEKVNA